MQFSYLHISVTCLGVTLILIYTVLTEQNYSLNFSSSPSFSLLRTLSSTGVQPIYYSVVQMISQAQVGILYLTFYCCGRIVEGKLSARQKKQGTVIAWIIKIRFIANTIPK